MTKIDPKITKQAAATATAARAGQEKAEWDRLSTFEKLVKKYLPSQINSIAIFVSA